ncbi:MAG: ribonuclease HII [Deltaproteobacteria bacterium]|nr:ribonuclease HII [Deltaproteobacteria bacterium]
MVHPKKKKTSLLEFEEDIRLQGFQNIAGVDEVGRGCLAGPVVAACVLLPWWEVFEGVDDSKKLTSAQREKVFPVIIERAFAYGIGIVDAGDIDTMNIGRATLKAMRMAVESMQIRPDFLLVDGNRPITLMTIPQKPVIKGDSLSLSIAAASIVAKVTRDKMMAALISQFPGFRFDIHKGYGTKKHWEELERHGPTAIHRTSFKGVLRSSVFGLLKNRFTDFGFS